MAGEIYGPHELQCNKPYVRHYHHSGLKNEATYVTISNNAV